LNEKAIQDFFVYLKNYKPENSFIIQDSEFTRKNITRRYSVRLNIWSCSVEKVNYSISCKIDQTGNKYTPKELLNSFKKPFLITGIGLYGEMFIKELRLYEKIINTNPENRTPIIIFGSPKKEKLERIKNFYDILIDNTESNSLRKLDWIFSLVANFMER
jgi:hypothetical protein